MAIYTRAHLINYAQICMFVYVDAIYRDFRSDSIKAL